MKKALILTDGKAGHENQSKAFARALGFEVELREVHFKSKFHKALSYLFDRLGILSTSLFDCEEDLLANESSQSTNRRIDESTNFFAAVIGTGSGTFYAAKTLAKKLGVKCGVVLYPRGYRLSTFDCILAPAFDRPAKAENVIEIPANLVANDEEFYEKGVAAFKVKLGSDRVALGSDDAKATLNDAIAVIVGGPNKCSTMTPEWMKSELDKIFALAGQKAYDSKNHSTSHPLNISTFQQQADDNKGRQKAYDRKNFLTSTVRPSTSDLQPLNLSTSQPHNLWQGNHRRIPRST